MNPSDINTSLKDCRSLDSALSLVAACGIDSGTLRIAGKDVRGWIVFSNRKIKQAVVADTAQVGQPALVRLLEIGDAKCTYLSPDSNNTGDSAPMKAAPAPAPAHGQQSALTEDEFRAGVFGRDVQSEFDSRNPRLGDDAPVAKTVHYARIDRVDEPDETVSILAKTGFSSDFHDVTPTAADPWDEFHGDPQNLASAEAEIAVRRHFPFLKYAAAVCLFGVCFSIYAVPKALWDRADTATQADIAHRQSALIDATMETAAPAPEERPFALPQGSSSVASASSPVQSAAVGDTDMPPNVSKDSPDNLMLLIRWYLKHGNLRMARQMAAIAMRLPNASAAERTMFTDLYQHYLTEDISRLDPSNPRAAFQDYKIFVRSAGAAQATAWHMNDSKAIAGSLPVDTNRLGAIQRAISGVPH